MRTPFRRGLVARLGLIVVLTLVINVGVPWLNALAQDSGAATFTIAAVSGNVVVKRADGSGETARPGTVLNAGDELSSVGRSEVTLNLSSRATGTGSTGSGASLILFSDTTIGVRSPPSSGGSGGGGFYVADLAKGVVLAKAPPSGSATIQITNEHAGAVAQVNRGGMAVATDVDTGTVAVACDERTAEVAFPYTDMRVPCEANVVRTLSNTRAIEDQRRNDDSPVNAVVHAAGERPVQGTGNQGLGIFVAPSGGDKKGKDEDDKPQVEPAPATSAGGGGPFVIGASCPPPSGNDNTGGNSCTAVGSSLPGAQAGGTVTIVTQTKHPSTLAVGEETFPCGPISGSGPSVSCGFTTANRIFQGGVITFTIPLAAGGTRVITQFWNCGVPQPTGTICP